MATRTSTKNSETRGSSKTGSTAADDADTPTTSARTIWKGAISFGLVHVPVALYTAVSNNDIDFDWLDRRTMDPVGYKRYNKKTGEEIESKDIVKGVAIDDGKYVVLSNDEIKSAFPKATQTIDIEAFVNADDIPFVHLEKPYYLEPINKGEKVYALLREALIASSQVGVARVVIQGKQHLAALMPVGRAMVLNLLRWGSEIRSHEALKLPPAGVDGAGIKPAEMKMAKQLIAEMSTQWDAKAYRDSFGDEIMRLVRAKAKVGDVADVGSMEASDGRATGGGATIIDLTELLKRSLRGGSGAGEKPSVKSATKDKVPPAAAVPPKVKRATASASATPPSRAKRAA